MEAWYSRPVRRESELVAGTRCNGCPSFEVLVRRVHAREVEEYWCDKHHGRIDPRTASCPAGRRADG